jgi:hypothetical protein
VGPACQRLREKDKGGGEHGPLREGIRWDGGLNRKVRPVSLFFFSFFKLF